MSKLLKRDLLSKCDRLNYTSDTRLRDVHKSLERNTRNAQQRLDDHYKRLEKRLAKDAAIAIASAKRAMRLCSNRALVEQVLADDFDITNISASKARDFSA